MIKRLAWKLQAREFGGLSERALRRAAEIADTCDLSDLRLTAPKSATSHAEPDPSLATSPPTTALDRRLPMPGTLLTRKYKGQTIQVMVLADGFQFEGEKYKSLSAVAKVITGSHWNGFHFFGLKKTEASGMNRKPARRQANPFDAPSTPARAPRKASIRNSTRSMLSGNPARRSSRASSTKDGFCLPDHYDDGGFTGGNMDRPALTRLLADIEAGKIDCVVVYKMDRLSRSLLDFARR